jgi:hypothetical protein
MSAINCPHCRATVSISEALAGRPLVCPVCGTEFSIPPIASSPDPIIEFNPYSTMLKRRLQRPTSFWDIFDFKFEKYLTPWIIRATWICVCALSAVSLLVLVITMIADSVTVERNHSVVGQESTQPKDSDIQWSFADNQFTGTAKRIGIVVIQVVATILGLLWIRVILETEIVIFNIATSIASIDRKTKEAKRTS